MLNHVTGTCRATVGHDAAMTTSCNPRPATVQFARDIKAFVVFRKSQMDARRSVSRSDKRPFMASRYLRQIFAAPSAHPVSNISHPWLHGARSPVAVATHHCMTAVQGTTKYQIDTMSIISPFTAHLTSIQVRKRGCLVQYSKPTNKFQAPSFI